MSKYKLLHSVKIIHHKNKFYFILSLFMRVSYLLNLKELIIKVIGIISEFLAVPRAISETVLPTDENEVFLIDNELSENFTLKTTSRIKLIM